MLLKHCSSYVVLPIFVDCTVVTKRLMEVNSLRLSSTLPVTTQCVSLTLFLVFFFVNKFLSLFFCLEQLLLWWQFVAPLHGFWSPIIYAFASLTGGVTEPVDLEAGGYAGDDVKRDELFKTLKKSSENRALMAAAIPVSDVTTTFLSFFSLGSNRINDWSVFRQSPKKTWKRRRITVLLWVMLTESLVSY